MSEAVRDGWGLAVASLLGGEASRISGDVLDAGGGAAIFARSLPDARLTSAEAHDTVMGSFDAVLSVSQIQFAKDPATEVAAMARACRPGGVVLLIVPHALQDDMTEARSAFTLRGLHALASGAGLEVEYARAVNPPDGGVLRRELEAFRLQSGRHIVVLDEINGWVDVMDEQRPMLLAAWGSRGSSWQPIRAVS